MKRKNCPKCRQPMLFIFPASFGDPELDWIADNLQECRSCAFQFDLINKVEIHVHRIAATSRIVADGREFADKFGYLRSLRNGRR